METRNESGQYASRGMPQWEKKIIIAFAAIALVYLGGTYIAAKFTPQELVAFNNPVAHADEVKQAEGLTVAQLEDKLDAIVWQGESKEYSMQDGDTFMTFDPPTSWSQTKILAICLKTGGRINEECYSHGPRQEKIPTIESYWPQLHNGEKITDKDARDIAESDEGSKEFFLQCSEEAKDCANNWTSFKKKSDEGQIYLDLIREAKGISI